MEIVWELPYAFGLNLEAVWWETYYQPKVGVLCRKVSLAKQSPKRDLFGHGQDQD